MARPSHLATRLLDVLDAQRRRDALTRRLALPGAVTAALLVLPVAALRPANPPAAAVTGVQPAAASRLLGDEDFRAPARRMSQSSEKPDTGDCAKSRASSTSETSHNHVVTLMVQVGRCVEELRATAPFKLNADFTDIAAIDDDGAVTVEQSGGDVDHRVELRAKGATITRRWCRGNSERTDDATPHGWC